MTNDDPWDLDPDLPADLRKPPDIGECPVCGWPVGDVRGHVAIAHPNHEPAIDPIHWSSAVDTSDMKRVGPTEQEPSDD